MKDVRRGAGRGGGGGEAEKDVTHKPPWDPLLLNDAPEAIYSEPDAHGNRAGPPGREINGTAASLFYLPTASKRFSFHPGLIRQGGRGPGAFRHVRCIERRRASLNGRTINCKR